MLPPPLQDLLPAGWLAFTGRELNPLDRVEGFQITSSSSLPGLFLAQRPLTMLPARAIGPTDTWCEDPTDRRYNRAIKLGAGATGDRLQRADALYDMVIEIDHNAPP